MNVILTIVSSLLTVLLFLYHTTTRKFDYWKKRKVPFAKPLPLFGNYAQYILQRKFTTEISQELCRRFPDEPYFGTFFGTEPALIVQDPDLIKLILTKEFYYFNSRELMDYTTREVVTQNLFFSYGDQWKVVRQGLTPLFSSAKMKNMFYLIRKCAFSFEAMLDYEMAKSKVFNTKEIMIRYTMDCICSCAFGIDVKTMERNQENNVFLTMGHLIFSKSMIRGFQVIGRAMWPRIFYNFGLQVFPREVDKFFHSILTEVFEARGYEPSERNDFVDLVLGLKKNKYIVGDSMSNLKTGGSKKIELEVTDNLLVSQCVVFFGAGFENSASVLSHTLFELAKNQEAQRKAQQEVDAFLKRHNNEVVDDCVTELSYLNACLLETLRLYPVLSLLTREVVSDYKLPSGFRLERGMRIHIPVYHIHRDARHFSDPELYKPERFLPDAEEDIKPYTYFPYGEGPRICIGMRFARMQMIPSLLTFLKKFHVILAEGTPSNFRHGTTTRVLQPASELLVRVSLREGWEERLFKR